MSKSPGTEKNFWIAMGLSALILMGYPFFLKWLSPHENAPSQAPNGPVQSSQPNSLIPVVQTEKDTINAVVSPLSPPQTTTVQTEAYEMEFSALGGSVSRLIYKGEKRHASHTNTVFYEGSSAQPGLFNIRFSNDPHDPGQKIFNLTKQEPGLVEFVYEQPGDYRLTKQYYFRPDTEVIELKTIFENLSPYEKNFPVEIIYGLKTVVNEHSPEAENEAVVWTDRTEHANLGKIKKKGFFVSKEIAWAGLLKRYFAILVKPSWKTIANEVRWDKENLWAAMKTEPVNVKPQAREERDFFIYAGPQRYETLKSFGLGYEEILSRGIFGIFKIWLLRALKFCDHYTHNFGWAIILVTCFLKLLFTPLTHISFESMKKMQALQPKIKSIQERHKKDPSKMNKEMMDLYKRNRVNPMSGCLPMVLQIPIFFAFYQVLSGAIELKGAPFVGWITDLSEPDKLFMFPMDIPFLGDSFHVLPLLMLGSMFWQQKLTPQAGATPEQTKIMTFMPLIFGFVFYKMPSGLVLYWFVNNMLSIIHQGFVKKMVVVLHHEDNH